MEDAPANQGPISVIVPVLNDAECLDRLCRRLETLPHIREVIVADGGSNDGLPEVVGKWGLLLVSASRGRGPQLNRGADAAEGEVYWFLHADALPFPDSTEKILEALKDPGVIGGAFRLRLSESRWYGRLLGVFVGWRSRLFGLPYGDQGYFVRRSVFEEVGGYPNTPIMEDVGFIDRARGKGEFRQLAVPIGVSPRRWDREGFVRRTLANWWMFLRYRMGTPPEKLVADYPAGESRKGASDFRVEK